MGKSRPVRRPTEEAALSHIMREQSKAQESADILAKREHQKKMWELRSEAEKFFGGS